MERQPAVARAEPSPVSGVPPLEVVVVGGGASGVLVSARLLDASVARPVRVQVVEPSGRLGAGVAYGTDDPEHLLNVRAGGMSADPSLPAELADWVAARQLGDAGSFIARRHYRAYLSDHLALAVGAAADGHVDAVTDAVVALEPVGGRIDVACASGARIRADQVVLAIGNSPPGIPAPLEALTGHPRWVSDPWAPGALAGLGDAPDVVLVGSGLTMIDVAITLGRGGGRMRALSRHGLLPRAHLAGRLPVDVDLGIDLEVDAADPVGLLGRIRDRGAAGPDGAGPDAVGSDGVDWRDVVDALRPYGNALWQRLSPAHQRSFVTHVSRYWDVHRHRMSPDTEDRLRGLVDRQQLTVHAGRVLSAGPRGAGIELSARVDGRTQRWEPDVVINCTGPGRAWEPPANPVVAELLRRGLARTHPLGMGLATVADGRLVGADGAVVDAVTAIGPPRRGTLFETTAVPELRSQALHIADRLLVAR